MERDMKTTKNDYEEFKGHAEKWRLKLGLTNWAVYYKHEKINEAYANISWSSRDQIATIKLSTGWDTSWRSKDSVQLERCALHEVLHLLMIQLYEHADSRYTTAYALEQAEHSIIRQLEGVLL